MGKIINGKQKVVVKKEQKGKDNVAESCAEFKLMQSNFATQMKHLDPNDPDFEVKKTVYLKYKSFGLRDPRKQELVKRWQQDKSCKWLNSLVESKEEQTKVTESDVLKGWGNKPGPDYHQEHCVSLL